MQVKFLAGPKQGKTEHIANDAGRAPCLVLSQNRIWTLRRVRCAAVFWAAPTKTKSTPPLAARLRFVGVAVDKPFDHKYGNRPQLMSADRKRATLYLLRGSSPAWERRTMCVVPIGIALFLEIP